MVNVLKFRVLVGDKKVLDNSDKHFVNSTMKTNILFENRKRIVFEILEHLP